MATAFFSIFQLLADFYLNARQGDKGALKKNLGELLEEAEGNTRLLLQFSPLYSSLFKDDNKTIKLLEKINKNYFSYGANSSLAYYYNKQGKKNKSLNVILKDLKHLSIENYYLSTIIKKLHSYERYEESLPYIETALDNFPYSFVILELKGNALLQLDKKEKAIEVYEKSLSYNTGYVGLRKKIRDLKNEDKLLDKLIPKDVYSFIKENRNKIKLNNYYFSKPFKCYKK